MNMYGFTPLEALLYLILVFSPFLFIIVLVLACHYCIVAVRTIKRGQQNDRCNNRT